MEEIIFIYNFADELLYFNKIIENKDLNIKYLYDYDAKDVKEIMRPGTLLQVGPVTTSVGGAVGNAAYAAGF